MAILSLIVILRNITMTAQIPEKLKYKGKKYDMCSEPLKAYFALTGNKFR